MTNNDILINYCNEFYNDVDDSFINSQPIYIKGFRTDSSFVSGYCVVCNIGGLSYEIDGHQIFQDFDCNFENYASWTDFIDAEAELQMLREKVYELVWQDSIGNGFDWKSSVHRESLEHINSLIESLEYHKRIFIMQNSSL